MAVRLVRVRLLMFRTEDGGRKAAIESGLYRAGWTFDTDPDEKVFREVLEEVEGQRTGQVTSMTSIELGVECDVEISPLVPEAWESLKPGSVIYAHEGLRVVGRGTVVSLH